MRPRNGAQKTTLSPPQKTWEPPQDFRVVVLSYRRAEIFRSYTYRYLKHCGIPDSRIQEVGTTICCHSQEEFHTVVV